MDRGIVPQQRDLVAAGARVAGPDACGLPRKLMERVALPPVEELDRRLRSARSR